MRVSQEFSFQWLFSLMLVLSVQSASNLYAQDVRVQATLDTTALRIGEQTSLRLTVEHSHGVQVRFPMPPDSLSPNIEIVSRSAVDSSDEQGRAIQRQIYTITSFTDGLHDIPALTVQYRKPNDTALYSIQTPILALTVQGVPADTTNRQIRDIKPPMAVERTFAEIAPYLLIALGVIAAIVGGVYWWRKRKPVVSEEIRPSAPSLPPYQMAMEELERLEQERLWQAGDAKEYHTRLADIVRVYVERSYNVTTLEATSDEILAQFRMVAAPTGSLEKLRSVLKTADMVKFARYEALPDENDRSMKLAKEFVTITTLKPETQENITLA
ncbi:MAG: hypothetical protein EAZ92_07990 [Candidatus Kapaibacterium sp.]|nr:MAG: hypothetical protein EAZ92_07990 [Candidatus Kapabacteria bacterium]